MQRLRPLAADRGPRSTGVDEPAADRWRHEPALAGREGEHDVPGADARIMKTSDSPWFEADNGIYVKLRTP